MRFDIVKSQLGDRSNIPEAAPIIILPTGTASNKRSGCSKRNNRKEKRDTESQRNIQKGIFRVRKCIYNFGSVSFWGI